MERPQSVLRRWIIAFVVGEIVGFGLAGAAAALTGQINDGPSTIENVIATVAGGVLAGVIEGGAVGWFQGGVVRDVIPGVTRRQWIAGTIAGGIAAWVLGLALGSFGADLFGIEREPSTSWMLGGSAVLGLALGALLGVGQWYVVRSHVVGAGRWIVANAIGWTIGMVVPFAASDVIASGIPMGAAIVLVVTTGAVMALAPAWVTGRALRTMATDARR